jgi:heme-degrading monooxygenase HmoA
MLVIVWRFRPAAGREADFRRAYGPDGAWARLFARAPGYLGTELLRDRAGGVAWITIDRWRSALEHAAFASRHADAYAALDRECAALTAHEEKLGEYEGEEPVPAAS